jgi:hypothetical protein
MITNTNGEKKSGISPIVMFVIWKKKKLDLFLLNIEYKESDLEWRNWWKVAYARHPEGLTIHKLMEEIVKRHKNRRKS